MWGNMQPPPSGNETPVDKVWRDSTEDSIRRKLPGVISNTEIVQFLNFDNQIKETVPTSEHRGSSEQPVFLYKGL